MFIEKEKNFTLTRTSNKLILITFGNEINKLENFGKDKQNSPSVGLNIKRSYSPLQQIKLLIQKSPSVGLIGNVGVDFYSSA